MEKTTTISKETKKIVEALYLAEQTRERYYSALIDFYGDEQAEAILNEKFPIFDATYKEIERVFNEMVRERLNETAIPEDYITI